MHTTNYHNTFIEVAHDCPVNAAEVPPLKGEKKSIANRHFEALVDHPYEYTSDDVLFAIFAQNARIHPDALAAASAEFFSKGQPCMRCSPLTKRYGWGVHSDGEGRIALYAIDSEEYRKLAADSSLKHVRAMRSKRA